MGTYTQVYDGQDLGEMSIDIAGVFMNALVGQMGPIAQITAVGIILGVLGGLLYLVFGTIHTLTGGLKLKR